MLWSGIGVVSGAASGITEDILLLLVVMTIMGLTLVTITSNRGLCGGFNAYIIKSAKSLINNDYKSAKVDVLSIGKKSSEHFTKNGFSIRRSS